MMAGFALVLRRLALVLRQLGALVALFLSVRLLWMSGQAGLRQLGESAGSHEVSQQRSGAHPPEAGSHRPDLEQLKELVGEESREPPANSVEDGPILRRILVDLGPERSEVFVRGKRVGKTPFGGQVSCAMGEILKIQILPPRGVPLVRTVTCRGDTLIVRQ